MKKNLLPILLALISCSTYPSHERQNIDSIAATDKRIVDSISRLDSLANQIAKSASKKGLKTIYNAQDSCPLKVVKYWLTRNSINTPEANVTYKNISNKVIDGIKVGIECYNNFDEPVNSGYSNVFGGIDQDKLRPGRQNTATWTMSLFDNTTKIKPFIREVHFTDGTTWANKE